MYHTIMTSEPVQMRAPAIRALKREIVDAGDPQIMRIVATVDAMMRRGSADQLIEPLRQRLARLRPPRPLRFGRLMFHPLDLLIVPPARWRPGQQAIPRTALMPMAEHVRLAMGAEANAIEAEISGCTTDDDELISRLGRTLWPVAARILADSPMPGNWNTTEISSALYRPLASLVSTMLAEACALETLWAQSATGLLPPEPQVIEAILTRVARSDQAALPMMIAVLLDRLPEAVDLLPPAHLGREASTIHAAMDEATDLLLRQLDQEEGTETRIAAGTLADAGAAASRIAGLLKHLDTPNATPQRRDRLRVVRLRLEAGCKARFASGLEDELLAPLQHVGTLLDAAQITALESAARGLRVLEAGGRLVGSGSTYDLLLNDAAAVIKTNAMRDRLALPDQLRLIEILSGPEAALEMFDHSTQSAKAITAD